MALPDPPAPVARQLAAYNAAQLDAFAACYSDGIVLEDAVKGVFVRGQAQLRERYGALFRDFPGNRATVTNRSVVAPWVFEEEDVQRDARTRFRVFVVYRVEGDLITRGTFYRGEP